MNKQQYSVLMKKKAQINQDMARLADELQGIDTQIRNISTADLWNHFAEQWNGETVIVGKPLWIERREWKVLIQIGDRSVECVKVDCEHLRSIGKESLALSLAQRIYSGGAFPSPAASAFVKLYPDGRTDFFEHNRLKEGATPLQIIPGA